MDKITFKYVCVFVENKIKKQEKEQCKKEELITLRGF